MPLTVDQKRRFSRQIRLADIGEAGQERLCDARVSLRSADALAREIESAYVKATGMTPIDERPQQQQAEEIPIPIPDLGLRHDIPRAMAEGALFALASFSREVK